MMTLTCFRLLWTSFPCHARVMASLLLLLQHRIAKHKFDDCVFMASFSDSGSNCELAKGMLTPGDEEPCFHHKMKLMLDDVIGGAEGGSRPVNATAATDLLAVGLLVAIVRANTSLRKEMSVAAEKAGTDNLELIAANITRWEGRYRALKRFLQLQSALIKVHSRGSFAPFIERPKMLSRPTFCSRRSSSGWARTRNC